MPSLPFCRRAWQKPSYVPLGINEAEHTGRIACIVGQQDRLWGVKGEWLYGDGIALSIQSVMYAIMWTLTEVCGRGQREHMALDMPTPVTWSPQGPGGKYHPYNAMPYLSGLSNFNTSLLSYLSLFFTLIVPFSTQVTWLGYTHPSLSVTGSVFNDVIVTPVCRLNGTNKRLSKRHQWSCYPWNQISNESICYVSEINM